MVSGELSSFLIRKICLKYKIDCEKSINSAKRRRRKVRRETWGDWARPTRQFTVSEFEHLYEQEVAFEVAGLFIRNRALNLADDGDDDDAKDDDQPCRLGQVVCYMVTKSSWHLCKVGVNASFGCH